MTETDIQSQIMITASELGCIPLRLNSGKAWQGDFKNGVISHPRAIRLCPEGTADLLIICPGGVTLWIECKTLTGKQREVQKRFQNAIEMLGHKYLICRSKEEAYKSIQKYLTK